MKTTKTKNSSAKEVKVDAGRLKFLKEALRTHPFRYDTFSSDLTDALAPSVTLRSEQGVEIFYNFAVTPWLSIGADLQIIRPALASETALFTGMRAVLRF